MQTSTGSRHKLSLRGAIPAICMDQTSLHGFVAELLRHERFRAFVDALPARARVSESVLPLVLAALHEDLGRALLVVLPEDADARDAADGAGWFADLAPSYREAGAVAPRPAVPGDADPQTLLLAEFGRTAAPAA